MYINRFLHPRPPQTPACGRTACRAAAELPLPPESHSDFGDKPFIVDINKAAGYNGNFRTALWTGGYLQLTLMSIPAGGEIGLEIHPDTDQFLRIERGSGLVMMGGTKDNLTFQQPVYDDSAICIPAGTWHNLINTGDRPIQLYSVYAPPHHPKGTVHPTKAAADAAEGHA